MMRCTLDIFIQSACRPLFAPPFISVGERTPHLCLVPQHATPLVPPALPRAMPRRFLSPLAVPRTFIMLSPSLPAAPRALTCHSFVPPAMLARSPAGPYRRRLCPACRPVTPSRRYCMPHVPPCYSLPPLATPRALPSQPHLFKLATVPADQQGASRPESLSDADPLRVQMPPRPSSTAIQSPALCFHPPPRPSSDPTDTRAQVSLNAPSQTNQGFLSLLKPCGGLKTRGWPNQCSRKDKEGELIAADGLPIRCRLADPEGKEGPSSSRRTTAAPAPQSSHASASWSNALYLCGVSQTASASGYLTFS
ncbi:hypothetical protein EDB84DRAFT_1564704 [Lactarius hengduanensis]|nr:hypothetical protein EDB84DRAFT_1564704 [Lactarius hengduanensis]